MALWESQSGNAKVYTMLRLIYPEPCFFILLSQETDIGRASQPRGHCPWLDSLMMRLIYSADCSLQLGLKNSCHYTFFRYSHISFWCPTYVINMEFLLSLVYLETQLHILLFKIYANCTVKGQYVTQVVPLPFFLLLCVTMCCILSCVIINNEEHVYIKI